MIADILARLRVVAEADPFLLTETNDPFSFDLQPAQRLNRAYRLEARLVGQEGYLGPHCLETWEISLWLAQRTQGDPTAAYQTVLTDVSSLTAAVEQDGSTSGVYDVVSQNGDLPAPPETADYVVACLRATLDFDRAL